MQNLSNSLSSFSTWAQTEVSTLINCTESAIQTCIGKIGPCSGEICDKITELWKQVTPYFEQLVEFLKSNLGISCMLILGSIISIHAALQSENRITSTAFVVLGLICAMGSGAFLLNTGLVPGIGIVASAA